MIMNIVNSLRQRKMKPGYVRLTSSEEAMLIDSRVRRSRESHNIQAEEWNCTLLPTMEVL